MARARLFGMSTQLYHGQRLTVEHLREIGAAGFDAVELFATRTHVDYHNESTVADLGASLVGARLTLESVHAPVAESFMGGRWGEALNLASPDTDQRLHALDEATRALHVARRVPFRTFVVHAGVAGAALRTPGSNNRDAARRSIEALATLARPLDVTVAVELVPNELSKSGSLVHFVEDVLDAGAAGICLDIGHAHLEGDVMDVIETIAEHVVAVHAHDNRGRTDDHLVPFEGTVDWAGAMTALQKVGYEGPLILEVLARGTPKDTLVRARNARGRMERMLAEGLT